MIYHVQILCYVLKVYLYENVNKISIYLKFFFLFSEHFSFLNCSTIIEQRPYRMCLHNVIIKTMEVHYVSAHQLIPYLDVTRFVKHILNLEDNARNITTQRNVCKARVSNTTDIVRFQWSAKLRIKAGAKFIFLYVVMNHRGAHSPLAWRCPSQYCTDYITF